MEVVRGIRNLRTEKKAPTREAHTGDDCRRRTDRGNPRADADPGCAGFARPEKHPGGRIDRAKARRDRLRWLSPGLRFTCRWKTWSISRLRRRAWKRSCPTPKRKYPASRLCSPAHLRRRLLPRLSIRSARSWAISRKPRRSCAVSWTPYKRDLSENSPVIRQPENRDSASRESRLFSVYGPARR